MRTEQEMMDLILSVSRSDERIRAVLLSGSRANPSIPADRYQDYDITYFVHDIQPFYNNPDWVTSRFGKRKRQSQHTYSWNQQSEKIILNNKEHGSEQDDTSSETSRVGTTTVRL